MSEAIQKFVFADANEVRVVMQNGEPWFIAKDVCEILGTRSDNVRQIVGNKRVMSINPYTIGVGNHGGKDILIVNEAGLYKLVLAGRKKEAVKTVNEQNNTIREQQSHTIKGTKHTKDECVLLDMYNNGRIGIIPTII